MDKTDEELIQQYLAGDAASFTELFHRHKGKILNFALRILGNRADAEDVTSETFIRLFERRYQDTGTAKLTTWLFTVARNAALSRLRTRNMLQSLWFKRNNADDYEEQDIPDTADLPDEQLREKEQAQTLKRALASLPHDQREALVLREYCGKSYAEIATILSCSLEKVKVDIYRGREALKSLMAGFIKEEEA